MKKKISDGGGCNKSSNSTTELATGNPDPTIPEIYSLGFLIGIDAG